MTYLTPDRDALAKALAEHEYDAVLRHGAYVPGCKCGWAADHEWEGVEVFDEHHADALIASDAVVSAAALADDEALVRKVAQADYDMHAGYGARDFDDDWVTQAEQVLNALTAALTERAAR